uniref:Myb/SANT-like domain-containing protein n=1 Tax=Moniliophthora roreri TaxID=221103 RepID=A0A0W0FMR3_MONRR
MWAFQIPQRQRINVRITGLKKDWKNVHNLFSQSGFGFCLQTKRVSATPEVWAPLLKSNLYNARHRHKHCYPHYNDMLYINESIMTTGDGAFHPALPL